MRGVERDFEMFSDELGLWFNIRLYPSYNGVSVFLHDVTERKESEVQRERESQLLFDLYSIASEESLSCEERVQETLQLGRDYLDASFGFISKINVSDGEQEIVFSVESEDAPSVATEVACPSSCQKCELSDDDSDCEQLESLKLQISQEIFVNDSYYGMLCFTVDSVEQQEFSDNERAITELLAGWIGYEISQALNQRELKQQYERMDAFLGVLSHDLRNPLSVASGYLEVEQQERDSKNLEKIAEAHERIDEMITELLNLARSPDVIDGRDVMLQKVAEEAWGNVKHNQSSLVVETDMVVKCDAQKLLNVFENLFRNAVEHNVDAVEIVVGELSDGEGFYVADDGSGIEEGVELFNYSSPELPEGTQLGLLIVQEILSAHDWKITYDDEYDEGARFEVYF